MTRRRHLGLALAGAAIADPVKVTTDGGFIYDCRAYNGCAGLIACVEAYTRDGKLLSRQPWFGLSCGRRS